ncbi:hypothetical protein RU97_GL001931 [Enterococcus canis]|uniref:Oligosaccharide repeat unit polymerase n=1 Tax=Enterococcus canis TaxID=214095 RepID=A0A1L8RFM8_9ENTE|nr:O-antigen polymerase [Enterococcus canis]OJG18534.1 hypothetical protein RU97_GL001931 [Enterococcus canis]
MSFKLGIFLGVLYWIGSSIWIITSNIDTVIISSFFLANSLIVLLYLFSTSRKNNYFNLSIVIFFIIFFIIAPINQLRESFFPNTMVASQEIVVRGLLITSMFLFVYMISSLIMQRKSGKKIAYTDFSNETINNYIYIIMLSIFLIFFITNFSEIILKMTDKFAYSKLNLDSTKELIIYKCIFFFPLFPIINILSTRKRLTKKEKLFLTFCIILLILVKNPLIEKRNAIGPLYLSILLFFYRSKNLNNIYTLLLLASLTIFFPLIQIFTNAGGLNNLGEVDILGQLNRGYISLDYDAFSNLLADIQYVDTYGVLNFANLIGAILFFIPRSLWMTKPLSSGQMIGNYLETYHAMWFNNLSNPFVGEGYLAYGFLGVILFAIVLSIFGRKVIELLNRDGVDNFVGIFISVFLIFFLRGDLMNGIAYLMGFVMAIYFIPKFLYKVIGYFHG